MIQPFQQPERVLGFFKAYRSGRRVTRRTLTEIADHYVYWLRNRSEKWGAPIAEAPEEERRDDFVLQHLQQAEPDRVGVMLKGREPARILVAIGGKDNDSTYLEYKQRCVNQYNFYLNDKHWGPMFVRMCPYSRSPRGSASTNITGLRFACGSRRSTSSSARTRSSAAHIRNNCKDCPIH